MIKTSLYSSEKWNRTITSVKQVDNVSTWCWRVAYHLCSAVPSVFRCLVDTMKGCSVTGVYRHLNETLETILRNMTAYCPQSCDPLAGHNCSLTYYDRVVMSFVGGIDCPVLGRYVDRRPIVHVTTTIIIIIININTSLN